MKLPIVVQIKIKVATVVLIGILVAVTFGSYVSIQQTKELVKIYHEREALDIIISHDDLEKLITESKREELKLLKKVSLLQNSLLMVASMSSIVSTLTLAYFYFHLKKENQ